MRYVLFRSFRCPHSHPALTQLQNERCAQLRRRWPGVRTVRYSFLCRSVIRREGKPALDTLFEIVRAIDPDGIFLDTMTRGAAEFRAKLDAARPEVVLEGDGALRLERAVHDHHPCRRSGQDADTGRTAGQVAGAATCSTRSSDGTATTPTSCNRPEHRAAARWSGKISSAPRFRGASAMARSCGPCYPSSGISPGCLTAKAGRRWCRPNSPACTPRPGGRRPAALDARQPGTKGRRGPVSQGSSPAGRPLFRPHRRPRGGKQDRRRKRAP